MLDANLDNDQVVIVAHDPRWPAAFELEKAVICAALAGMLTDVQHIGSTAIPGLHAKPVIDLLVAVPHFSPVPEYVRRLEPLGYQHGSHPNEAVRIFFRKGAPRTHHLHIVEDGTYEHRRLILFRDYLLRNPETAAAYEELKRDLAARYALDRPRYTESKTEFIESIIAIADAENIATEGGRLTRRPC
jgi:GrpB-like predicted nucleotidyltransferase (UPF0157 family)